MIDLYNLSSNSLEQVDDSNVDEYLNSGNYAFAAGNKIPLQNLSGQASYYEPEEAARLYATGDYLYSPMQALEQEYGSPLEQAKAAGTGVLQSVSFGTGEPALIGLGWIDKEKARIRDELYPKTKVASEIAGDIAQAALLGGSTIPELGAKYTAKKIAPVALEETVKQIAKKTPQAVKTALKFGSMSAGRGVTEDLTRHVRDDADFTGESVAANAMANFGIGAAIGGGGSLLFNGGKKAINKLKSKSAAELVNESEDALGMADIHEKLDKFNYQVKDKDTDQAIKRYVRFFEDADGNIEHQGKGYIATLDKANIASEILDIGNKAQVDEFGKRYGVENLFDEIESVKMDVDITTDKDIFNFIRDIRKRNIESDMIMLDTIEEESRLIGKLKGEETTRKLSETIKQHNRLRERIAPLMEKFSNGTITDVEKKTLNQLQKKIGDKIKFYKQLKKSRDMVDTISNRIVNEEIIDTPLAIKKGSEYRFFNNDDLKGAISQVKTASKNIDLNLGSSDALILKSIGAKPKDLKKYGATKLKNIVQRIRKFAKNGKYINNYNPEKLLESVTAELDKNIVDLNMLYAQADNIADKSGGYNVTYNNMRNFLNFLASKESVDPVTGLVDEVYKANTKKFINDVFNVYAGQMDNKVSATAARTLRQQVDDFVKFSKLDEKTSKELAAYSARNNLNEIIYKMFDFSDDSQKLLKKLKKANGEYSENKLIFDYLTNKMTDQLKKDSSGNILEPFFGRTAKIAYASKAIGDFIYDKVGINAIDTASRMAEKVREKQANIIGNAGRKFVENAKKPNYSKIVADITARKYDHKKDYEKDLKFLEELKANSADINEKIYTIFSDAGLSDENAAQAASESILRAYDLLDRSIPKKPSNIDDWTPPQSEMSRYRRIRKYIFEPMTAIKEISDGVASPEAKLVLKTVYPKIWQRLIEVIEQDLSTKKLSPQTKSTIRRRLGIGNDNISRYAKINMANKMAEQQGQKMNKADIEAKYLLTENQRLQSK